MLSHLWIVDRPRRRRTEDERDAGHLRIELREREELPTQLLGLLEEQVLDDDIRGERLDLIEVQARHGGRDPVTLLFEQLLYEIQDLLRVVDDKDMRRTAASRHGDVFPMRGRYGPRRSARGCRRAPGSGDNRGIPQSAGRNVGTGVIDAV
jgi:hypothetical protein